MAISRKVAAAAASVMLTGGMMAGAAPAMADYGPTAVYQVMLSTNVPGNQGGGVWLWLELSSDHSVDYQGADCGHGGVGAVHDGGATTWGWSGSHIVIPNVILNGLGGFRATVTTPGTTGHWSGTLGSFITLPPFLPAGAGFSQLTVAP
jgi:hypothetical protein